MSDIVIKAVVSPSPVIKPSNSVGLQGPRGWEVQVEYSVDGESWHTTPTSSDYYVHFSTDEGTTWGTAWYIRGEQGEQTGTTRFLNVVIDGGGEAIATGIKCDVVMPACTIVGAYLLADQSGSIKVDLWKDSYANFPPTNDDSICGGNEPEISSATKDSDTTLTDWTTSVSDGDIIRVNVDSCTTIERCTLSLKITT